MTPWKHMEQAFGQLFGEEHVRSRLNLRLAVPGEMSDALYKIGQYLAALQTVPGKVVVHHRIYTTPGTIDRCRRFRRMAIDNGGVQDLASLVSTRENNPRVALSVTMPSRDSSNRQN